MSCPRAGARAAASLGTAVLMLALHVLPAHGQSSAHREPYRDPTAAAARSLVFPGWGQHYNAEHSKGYLFTAGVAAGALFAFELLQLSSSEHGQDFERGAGLAFMGVIWAWSVGDAYATAPKINAENGYDVSALPSPPGFGVRLTLLHARF